MGQAPGAMLFIAVPAAVLAAASFGASGALQQRATKHTTSRALLDPRLVLELIRQPQWWLGIGAVVVGLALQVVALAFGPLMVVQPLLASSILFAAASAAWLAHRRLDNGVLVGAGCCVAGLAVFLVLANPSGDGQMDANADVWPLGTALAAGVVVCLGVAAASRFVDLARGQVRVAALALATGMIYGTTAGLIKLLTGEIRRDGPWSIFSHPELYVVCLIGPVGFLLSQRTFKEGVLIAPALAVISIVDPLVSVAIAVSWLGERVATEPSAVGGQAVGLAVLIAGIAALAQRAVAFRQNGAAPAGPRVGEAPARREGKPRLG